jgi:hypothetical protein
VGHFCRANLGIFWVVPKKTTPAAEPRTENTTEAPVAVQDAWAGSLDLARGIDNLFYSAACSDDRITQEGAIALGVITDRLLEHMRIVNAYFKGEEEGDEA